MFNRLRSGPVEVDKAGDQLADLLDGIAAKFEPRLRAAFLRAVEEAKGRIDVKALREAIEKADLPSVMRIVGLTDDGPFARLIDPLRTIFLAAAEASSKHRPGRLEVRFDMLESRTVGLLRDYGLRLVSQVTNDARLGVMEVLAEQMGGGANPRTVATQVGQIVGLTQRQSRAVRNYRKALEELKGEALVRRLRDGRFDRTVARAIDTQEGLSKATIDKMTARYAERALRLRGETIARTESIRAANLANWASMRQAIEAGKLPASAVTRRWVVARDERTCETCKPIPKLNANGVGMMEPFRTPLGVVQHPPLHPNCFPGGTLVASRYRITGQTERWYDGDVAVISVAGCEDLTVTVNHPVLTPGGWVPAGLLAEGSYVIRSADTDRSPAGMNHHEGVVARIGEIADALRRSGEMAAREVPVTAEHFHGDGAGSEVAVVRADRLLLGGRDAAGDQHLGEGAFQRRDVELAGLACPRCGGELLDRSAGAPNGGVSRGNLSGSGLSAHAGPLHGLLLGGGPELHAEVAEGALESVAADALLARQIKDGRAGEVVAAKVLRVRRAPFRGHVYNLQTEAGFYLAGGVYVHNCRCVVTFRVKVE